MPGDFAVVAATLIAILVAAAYCCNLYRLTVTERALRDLLVALESQGKDIDDLQRLHDAVQAAYKVVGHA